MCLGNFLERCPAPTLTQAGHRLRGNIREGFSRHQEGRGSSGIRHLVSAASTPASPAATGCSRSQGPAQDAGRRATSSRGLRLGPRGLLSGSADAAGLQGGGGGRR